MKLRNFRRLRRYVALLATSVLGVAGLGAAAIVGSPSANAATGCSVAYSIQSQWSTGFVASITITNLGSPMTSWSLGYSYSGNQQVSNGWNGTWTQSGENITVTNASFNGSVATNGTVNFGAQFSYSGTNTNPTTFTVNGVTCTGQTSGGGTLVVSPTAQNITQGSTGTVGVSLSAAPSANVTVTTALTSGNNGLSVSAGGSLTFTPSNFATAQNVTIAANSSGTGAATFTVSAAGFTSVTFTATETSGSGGTPTLVVSPTSQNVTQGTTGTVGISLSSAPTSNVTVTTTRTSGNSGLSVTAGGSLTFTPSNFGTAQSVTVTADSSSTGAATFTVSASGLTSVTFTATETGGGGGGSHVADPFTGAKSFLDPEFTKQVTAQATADGSAAEARVANFPTAYWLDTMCSIAGGSPCNRMGLQAELTQAAAQGTASTPAVIEIVVYDLPGRDCAALASNGEIPATSAGLTEYETQYINPIASILSQNNSPNLRVVAIIEPDSLPNVVTNQSAKPACGTAAPFYEQGITYALNKLHAISNVYNYMDIAHSAWLGWPNNMNGTPAVYNSVVQATTAKYDSIDGFISDTANYTPTQEPLLTNPTLTINGQQVMSANFYQFNPTFDELSYDTAMYNTLVSAGFPTSKRFLIDTSRNGWGPTHPTTITQASDVNTYVSDNKIDARPFRGDWCNINGAGIGARPTDEPFGTSSPVMAFVWIKPPGFSDGDYPTSTHSHGDPHCDPNGTQTDGNGNTYPTDAIPGFDVAAGLWFPAEFQMLVKNAFPGL
ncbi:MAG TPA: glycoside hydrolase family 6 protein [Streptosporangiaceae bacterium]